MNLAPRRRSILAQRCEAEFGAVEYGICYLSALRRQGEGEAAPASHSSQDTTCLAIGWCFVSSLRRNVFPSDLLKIVPDSRLWRYFATT